MVGKEKHLKKGKQILEIVHGHNKTKILTSLICGIIFTSLFILNTTYDVTIPYLKYASRVAKDTKVYEFLQKESGMALLSVYLFNITNAPEFMDGIDDKLKVQPVGPYTYREFRRNDNLDIDEEAGELRYSPHNHLTFVPELSVARPEDVNITMPNIPMLGLASVLNNYGFFVRSGFNVMARNLNAKPLVTMDAASYMWGYYDPLVYMGNKLMPGYVTVDKMGFLAKLYASDVTNDLVVSARDEDKFMIKSRNGHKKLLMSENQDPDECTQCSTFEDAYEGMVYPSALTRDFHLRLFRNGLCKIVDMKFNDTMPNGYGGDAFVYKIDDNFFRADPEEESDGNLLLPKCFNDMPLAISKALFLDADPKVYEKLEGIHPIREEHESYVIIDPKIGMTLDTKFSLQINLVLGDVSHNRDAKSFTNMVLPICYMKIVSPPLPQENRDSLMLLYSTWPKILIALQIISALLSIISWRWFVIQILKCRGRRKHVNNGKVFSLSGTSNLEKSPIVLVEQPLMENNYIKC